MCGFVGFTHQLDIASDVLRNMMDRIKHRGPDSGGEYSDGCVSMGFRRLSIRDIQFGEQPMFNEDKSLVLVFNGEIYNADFLRNELLGKGHKFSNNSDSEVLLHLYEEFGYDFVKRLRGMFAFVIWDKKNKRLFGARDFFGIKPLYYCNMSGGFIFGSEIKSFLDHPCFVAKLNSKMLERYLSFQYTPCCDTFFEGVYTLPPAHYFLYENNEMVLERYWDISFEEDREKDLKFWVDGIVKIFDDSILAHKISDVEVGSLLSSGIDSSYVVCSADVQKTFTVGFLQNGYSEIDYAKKLSQSVGVKNISKLISADEFWDNFEKIQYHMDEPLADPAAVALYFVCREASKYVKVVLSGEGADEIFGGYNIYKDSVDHIFYDKVPFFIRRFIALVIKRIYGERFGANYFIRRGTLIEDRFIGNAYIFKPRECAKILKSTCDGPSPKQICKQFYDKVKSESDVTKMQFIDLNMWLVGDILLKADKMSMANSLELRVPFLDIKLFDFARHIPVKFRVNRENTKFALRKAATMRMPTDVAYRKKLGFPVPIRVWLRQDKYYNLVLNMFESSLGMRFFNVDELRKLLNEHKNCKKDNSRKIWTVYTFLVWYKRFFCAA